jgi:DNA-directed RNA polymerase specialized sigma24 family protein
MPSKPISAARSASARFFGYGMRLGCALVAAGGMVAGVAAGLLGAAPAAAQQRPDAAIVLERLCAETLRPNEEDRLFGLISLTVRATIKYHGGIFSPDLIDDAVQDSLYAITGACRQLAATDDPHRLGRAVELARDATLKRMQDAKAGYNVRQTEKATAADLSQELSAPEIDAWLDALPARQRVLALLLYAAGQTPQEMADAAGLPVAPKSTALRRRRYPRGRRWHTGRLGRSWPPSSCNPAGRRRQPGAPRQPCELPGSAARSMPAGRCSPRSAGCRRTATSNWASRSSSSRIARDTGG